MILADCEAGRKPNLLRHLLTGISTLISLVLLCTLVRLIPIEIPSRESVASLIFVFLEEVRPEPMERRMFLASVAFLPFIIAGWHLIWRAVVNQLTPAGIQRSLLGISFGIVGSVVFYGYLVRKQAAFFKTAITAGGIWYVSCILVAVGLCFLLYQKNNRRLFWVNILLGSMSVLLLASIFLYGLYDTTNISDDTMYFIHFNALFHAVVQVYLGKELLVDFVNQYGLYPHFLEPLFRITGLGLLSFTVTMGGLTVLTFLLLLRTLLLATGNRTLALLGFLALASGGYLCKVSASYDPYFQYYPIRTIFPATVAWMLHRYLTTRSAARFAALYFISSCAILWNPETGVVVLFAVLLTTLYDEYARSGLLNGSLLLAKGVGIAIIVIVAFSCYLYFRYGAFPDYRELIRYSKIFYGIGFFMLPMVPLHPWNLVVIIYVVGLICGVGAVINGKVTTRSTMVTFLSLLGIGLFAYYQGRSHNEVFVLCIYPSFMLLTVYVGYLLDSPEAGRLSKISGYFGVAFLVLTAGGLYNGMRTLYYGEVGIVKRLANYRKGVPSEVMTRANFIKQRTSRGESVLILSGHSGLLHLVSQTTHPIRTPSIQETVLTEDYQRILTYLDQGPCRKLFIDVWWIVFHDPAYARLREILAAKYISNGTTPDLGVVMFERVR